MTRITIDLSKDELKILEKRAKKNFLSVKEQIEDVVRRSAIRTKTGSRRIRVDDRLVHIFSREKRKTKGKKKKKVKKK